MDGNHKLIRCGFVIHGCVDWYSRRVMFLQCSTNNRAMTVYDLFLNAVDVHGLSSRVRGVHGVENVDVAWHMFTHPLQGPYRGSEKAATINVLNAFGVIYLMGVCSSSIIFLDIWRTIVCLILAAILPRINRQLKLFQEGHDHHPLSSESNMIPMQLWVQGLLPYSAT